jgi:effector-binding domain-containing protein
MTNNKQKTAVEWQHIELMRINFEYSTNKITPREFQEQIKHILEQAKEMEKWQIKETASAYYHENTKLTPTQYYEQTYGGGEQ